MVGQPLAINGCDVSCVRGMTEDVTTAVSTLSSLFDLVFPSLVLIRLFINRSLGVENEAVGRCPSPLPPSNPSSHQMHAWVHVHC